MPRSKKLLYLFALLLCTLLHQSAFAEGDTVWTVRIPDASFNDVAYSPDGKYIAACSGYLTPVAILDPADGSVVRILRVPGETPKLSLGVLRIAFVGNNLLVAAINKDHKEYFIQFWDVETGEARWTLPTPTIAPAMAGSADGRYFAAGDGVENFWCWRIEQDNPKLIWQDTEEGGSSMGIWFSSDTQHILYSKGGVMKLRRVADSSTVGRWDFAYGGCVATPDLQYFLATIAPTKIGVFDKEHNTPVDTLYPYQASPGIDDIEMTKGGRYLVTSSYGYIEIWDFPARRTIRSYPGGQFSLSPDSAYILSQMGSGYLRLYRFNTTTTAVEHQPSDTPLSLRITPNPAEGSATAVFTLPEGSAQTVGIDILNTTGSLLTSLPQQTLQPGEHTLALPVGTLAAGAYFCRLRVGDMEQTVQFVVK